MSMPALPQTRWGLIAVVLLLDIGLAAAGAVMLQKGLAKPDAPAASDGSAKPAATTGQAAAAPAPTPPVAAPGGAPSPAVSASIATIANSGSAIANDPKSEKKSEPVQAKKSSPPPQHDAVKNELGAEIELAAARSRGDFDKCYDDASPDIHLKGRVDIAFTVLPDGRADDPHAVQNDTGSQQLATCLSATIAHWAFASHPAKPVLISRPFIYN